MKNNYSLRESGDVSIIGGAMERDFLTVYEATKRYSLSAGYLRLLLGRGAIKGDQVPVTAKRHIWLISKSSLKSFLATKRKPGRKPKEAR